MGGSIAKIISSFINDLLMPIISLIFKTDNLTTLYTVLGNNDKNKFNYGAFIGSLLEFIFVSLFVYIFLVVLYNIVKKKLLKIKDTKIDTDEVLVLKEIKEEIINLNNKIDNIKN